MPRKPKAQYYIIHDPDGQVQSAVKFNTRSITDAEVHPLVAEIILGNAVMVKQSKPKSLVSKAKPIKKAAAIKTKQVKTKKTTKGAILKGESRVTIDTGLYRDPKSGLLLKVKDQKQVKPTTKKKRKGTAL